MDYFPLSNWIFFFLFLYLELSWNIFLFLDLCYFKFIARGHGTECRSCLKWINKILFGFFSGCFPFDGKDPFVLETLPHVLFVGNQAKFAQKKLKVDDDKEVLLVTLPKFSSSSTVVLLNLQSLQCQPLIFSHFSK